MINERDFIRVSQPGVGEYTQARSAPIPDGATVLDEPATVGGAVRPDVPDPAPVPADEVPLPELVYARDLQPTEPVEGEVQPGGATETAPVSSPEVPAPPAPRRSPEQQTDQTKES